MSNIDVFVVLCDGSNFAVFAVIALTGFVVKVRFKLNRLHGLHGLTYQLSLFWRLLIDSNLQCIALTSFED